MDLIWSKTIASGNYDWLGMMQKRGSFKVRLYFITSEECTCGVNRHG